MLITKLPSTATYHFTTDTAHGPAASGRGLAALTPNNPLSHLSKAPGQDSRLSDLLLGLPCRNAVCAQPGCQLSVR